jgi:hypothetical protein
LDLDRNKLVPWHFGHGPKDPIIEGGFADLSGKVLCDRPDRCHHLSSLFLEMVDAHEAPLGAKLVPPLGLFPSIHADKWSVGG